VQIPLELQVIGWVGKDKVNAAFGQAVHDINAIPRKDFIQGKRANALGHYVHLSASVPGTFCARWLFTKMSQNRFAVNFFIESMC
jgi:hypothetical protein